MHQFFQNPDKVPDKILLDCPLKISCKEIADLLNSNSQLLHNPPDDECPEIYLINAVFVDSNNDTILHTLLGARPSFQLTVISPRESAGKDETNPGI
jgi:hypothetical protein